jgi:hypothetical protein
MPMANQSPAMGMLNRIFGKLHGELSDDDLDHVLLAVQLERARRRQARRKNPEVINP